MRKIILFVILAFNILCNAQEYTPLLDDVNEWKFTTCFMGDCINDVYFTNGDTLVNNKNYKVLDGYHYISRSFLLREEVVEKKVFLLTIINEAQREYLLYNFSMEIGDEIEMLNPITPFPESGGMYTLTNIESLPLVDGANYNHYYLSPSPNNTTSSWDAVWVEGLGSLSIITAPGGAPNFDGVGELSCFFKNEDLFYSNLERVPDCETQLGVDENSSIYNFKFISEENNLKIINTIGISKILLYTIEGKLILTSLNESNDPIKLLDTTNYSSGVYIVKLTNINGAFSSHKVIIN
ncbi:hypothetical protein ULMS_17970 [Patiriisocius marinistellae]|uniref:Secretion system C-terminal sorting domain-containing protein n=1 Tax=Patiriisocius marinistellae TaxID=2494560 RepID=A0A5J4G128_9FLAO|nr:T9SS type A sorting domain-containing protein [Patiriisocius marinistellae]GEQ86289.1 hypothetical protein ULMS_17970 [Patiriisocius marinistellae]